MNRLHAQVTASLLVTTSIAASSIALSQEPLLGQAVNERLAKSAKVLIQLSGQVQIVPPISDMKITYGPTAEQANQVLSNSKDITEVIRTLGAPYAVVEAGKVRVYRWGHGIDQMAGGQGSLIRDELLVFATLDGKIEGFSYKNKANITGLEPLQFIAGSRPP
jgi:hypothetical protein